MRSISPLTRGLLWLLTWLTMGSMWDVATLTLWSPQSMTYRLAEIAGDGQASLIASWYVGCALLCTPYLVALTFPVLRLTRTSARLACLGSALATVAWVSQAFLAFGHEGFTVIKFLYVRSAIESMAYAIFLGIVLNAELRRAAEAEGVDTGSADRVRLDSKPMGLH